MVQAHEERSDSVEANTGLVLQAHESSLEDVRRPKCNADLYRLWANHFTPVENSEFSVDIPLDWSSFQKNFYLPVLSSREIWANLWLQIQMTLF